jgi:hypothetical protein
VSIRLESGNNGTASTKSPETTPDVTAEICESTDYEVDVIDLPKLDYGKDAKQRNALVHECVHAWYDRQGDNTYGPWEEAVAYIAGALFTLNYEPKPNPQSNPQPEPPAPPWTIPAGHVHAPAHVLAFQIAGELLDKPAYIVPATDALKLAQVVIQSHSQFKGPGPHIYPSDGVNLR